MLSPRRQSSKGREEGMTTKAQIKERNITVNLVSCMYGVMWIILQEMLLVINTIKSQKGELVPIENKH